MKKSLQAKIISHIQETWIDYPDNNSVALIVYFVGCTHECKGCQNPQFQDSILVDDWITMEPKQLLDILKKRSELLNGTNTLVFSGGDPLHPDNAEFVKEFLEINDYFDICIYTGHQVKYVKKNIKLKGFKYLKCGKYEKQLKQTPNKTDKYMVFASKNQQLFNKKYRLLSCNGIYYFGGNS